MRDDISQDGIYGGLEPRLIRHAIDGIANRDKYVVKSSVVLSADLIQAFRGEQREIAVNRVADAHPRILRQVIGAPPKLFQTHDFSLHARYQIAPLLPFVLNDERREYAEDDADHRIEPRHTPEVGDVCK